MAGDWIQLDHELENTAEVAGIQERTDAAIDQIVGRLARFWCLADKTTTDGVLRGFGPKTLAIRCGGDVAFWEAVEAVGWVVFDAVGAHVPDFLKRFGKSARARLLDARRKKNKRCECPADDRTPTGRMADELRTDAGRVADAQPDADRICPAKSAAESSKCPVDTRTQESESESESYSDETRRDDQIDLVLEETRERVRDWCQRKFKGGSKPVLAGAIERDDRCLLLKVGALVDAGQIPEAWVDGALEAIRHHGGTVHNRVAYLQSILQERAAQAEPAPARKAGALNRLLVRVTIPEEMLAPVGSRQPAEGREAVTA